ncbi:Pr6Pr family membrane protein [Flavobacterium hungaricum]|uniref:Pr6Pr family membrane protein n=1 Tax=Flavobacterium hungaricum TaxID=2082725 RepID=A0ABR9TLN8_9FLAO|nr:Pr6Pr family membrane protein [Flavobacterium hungaricum]MBE8726283.1 hypothetical protein [Flavobacterium hungaricum]
MEKENTTKIGGEILLGIIFALELYALPMQFYLLINESEFSFFGAAIRFFSFFTILTNTLVAFASAVILFGGKFKLTYFFNKTATITAITVYILIVGIVFNFFLRKIVNLQGLHLIVSEIFHSIVPVLFLFFWFFYAKVERLSFTLIGVWLIYPIVYIIYTLLHGIFTDFYPYPFIDVTKLGFPTAIENGLLVLLAFVILSSVLIAVVKIRTRVRRLHFKLL